jgi:hypothetical protein
MFAVTACGGSDSGDSNDDVPRLVAEADIRLGDFDDPTIGFSRISGVDVDDDGNIYVLEGLDRQIRVYTPGGELLRRIGGPGDGPGEFGSIPRFGVIGDTVWTNDLQAGRLALFDRAGNVLVTGRTTGLRVALPESFGYVLPYMMQPDGRFSSFFGRVAYSRDDGPTGVDENDPLLIPRVLFDPTGAIVDTVGWDPSPPPRMVAPPDYDQSNRFQSVRVGSRPVYIPDPPPDLEWWYNLADGRIVIDSPTPASGDAEALFTVTRLDLDGDTVFSRRYTQGLIAYTSGDLDSLAAVSARGGNMFVNGAPLAVSDQDAAAGFRAIRGAMKFPEFRQAVGSAQIMNDERIWIRLDGPESADSVRWLILDADGDPVGEVALPENVRVQWSRGDMFWASEPDELDVPWLVRYKIRGG